MRTESAIFKHIKIGAVCILTIAGILLTPINNSKNDIVSVTKPGQEQSVSMAADKKQDTSADNRVINIFTCDEELEDIFSLYAQKHPKFKYKINYIQDANGIYFRQIISDLEKGSGNAADIYCVPGWYAREFIKGDYSGYACTYKDLGIDVDAALKKADIPEYAIEAGNNPNGDVVTLPYEPGIGVFMYRRSVAREVWGTDDPDKIAGALGAGTGKWDKFMEAARTLKQHGYYIVPGCEDIWPLVDARLKGYPEVNSEWLKFMDVSKALFDNGYIMNTLQYTDEWFNNLNGKGDKQIFGLVPSGFYEWGWGLGNTGGDWAVCLPPVSNIDLSSNTAILVNKNSKIKDKIRPLIEWIALDYSETGLQYYLANDELSKKNNVYGLNRPVVSGTVLKNVNGRNDFLGGQNINTVFYVAQKSADKQQGYNSLENSDANMWLTETKAYVSGEKDRKTAISDFLKNAKDSDEYFDTYYYDPAVNMAININTEDNELVTLVDKYAETHPEFKYKIHGHVGSLIDDNSFLTQIVDPIAKGDINAADIYSVPAMYASEFIKGKYAGYAATYKELGIDVDAALKKAGIPQCAIDAGTNPNGELIALPYETSAYLFMYRRSVARHVWGTDDPDKIAEIIGGGTDSCDKLIKAAQTLKRHGYYLTPGSYGIWPLFDTEVSNIGLKGNFNVSPKWEEFMDVSKYLFDNGCMMDTDPFTEEWSKALDEKSKKLVFGLIATNKAITLWYYENALKSTSGDWAVCLPPSIGLDQSIHSGIMVNKNSPLKDAIGPLIEWITLDSSDSGLQYRLANDALYSPQNNSLYREYGGKRFVISGTIMNSAANKVDFLGGQNINPVLCDAVKAIDSRKYQFYTSMEDSFATEWINMTKSYLKGEKSKEAAIAEFKAKMKDIGSRHAEYLNIIYGE